MPLFSLNIAILHLDLFMVLFVICHIYMMINEIQIPVSGFDNNCSDTPGVHGHCKAHFDKWTFNKGSCTQFVYGGCGGNGNRFRSHSQCQAVCEGGRPRVSPCTQPPSVLGACLKMRQRWTYMVETNSCQSFTYSGCSSMVGVENRFNSFELCVRTCMV